MELPWQGPSQAVDLRKLGRRMATGAGMPGNLPVLARLLGTVRVLVVEDDSMQREILKGLFDAANDANKNMVKFEVQMVCSATETLTEMRRVGASHYHIILLDCCLPDQNAFELLPELRATANEDTAIIIASVHAQMSLVQLCIGRGADAFLVKPLGSKEVRHIWQYACLGS